MSHFVVEVDIDFAAVLIFGLSGFHAVTVGALDGVHFDTVGAFDGFNVDAVKCTRGGEFCDMDSV